MHRDPPFTETGIASELVLHIVSTVHIEPIDEALGEPLGDGELFVERGDARGSGLVEHPQPINQLCSVAGAGVGVGVGTTWSAH